MMTFNDFIHKYKLKNKATSNIRIQQILSFIGLVNVGIHLEDGPISSDVGIANLHPSKKTHWVCYINENSFDSYRCVCPKKLSNFLRKRIGYCYVLSTKNKD